MIPYPQNYGVEIHSKPFYVLRESRDVIKMGAVRMWDGGPGRGCPVMDRLFRKTGLRVFTIVKGDS